MSGAVFIAVIFYIVQSYLNFQFFIKENFNSAFIDHRYLDFVFTGFINNLRDSLIILIIFLVLFYFIVKKITNWIVRPAEQAFEKQKDFIADASHELKTPLSVIIASSDALSNNPNETKWIKNIQEESSRMNDLITKLLDMASSEHTENLKFDVNNLSKTIELAALTFEGKAIEKNCKININIIPDIMFKYDENSIKQLIEILLDNAIKHSNVNSSINLSVKKHYKNIELIVSNRGDIIKNGEEEKIFERFYQLDKSRSNSSKNYGLGLAIAKNIVKSHNGDISAWSDNEFTYFKVVFK